MALVLIVPVRHLEGLLAASCGKPSTLAIATISIVLLMSGRLRHELVFDLKQEVFYDHCQAIAHFLKIALLLRLVDSGR